MKPQNRRITNLLRAKWKLLRYRGGRKLSWKIFLLWSFVIGSALGLIGMLVIYFMYLYNLPNINTLESSALEESSIVYDRKGRELYKFYSKENRIYVGIDAISKHIQDAIISTEDKTFLDNSGVDYRGLVRSGVNFLIGKTDKIEGTSTISQQLIKNFFLTNERSYVRKLREFYLSYQLNDTYSKPKILELYLNKISFGNNAAGIESAAQIYFGKSAKDVGILGATILASLPKGPSYFSPYQYKDRLMGELQIVTSDDEKENIALSTPELRSKYRSAITAFQKKLEQLEFERVNEKSVKVCNIPEKTMIGDEEMAGCETLPYSRLFSLIGSIEVSGVTLSGSVQNGNKETGKLIYNPGRKDLVAGRMFEDEKITNKEYIGVVNSAIDFEFLPYKEKILAPHFVFYVREYLESTYGKDFGTQQGLKIYTTLDLDLQKKAEEMVKKRSEENAKKHDAHGAALISVDNSNGQIIAMVGSPDYFDKKNGGQVNMITSKRQPGSTFKPLVYALAISKNPIGPETPIFDVDTSFGKWNPDNYDRKFLGKMDVRHALDYSRNIPAVKMFYMAGGEDAIIQYVQKMGIQSLVLGKNYGAPLSIGTGELEPIELAQAYSILANNGIRKPIHPILKIVDSKGNIIESNERAKEETPVFSAAASYIISVILSDKTARPNQFWNQFLTLKDRLVAAKTGTSNVDVSKDGKKSILPRDLWTAGYTPQYTTVVWVGNPNGNPTKSTCDGLNCAASIWYDFMTEIHKNQPVKNFEKPKDVYSATISKLTGKLAGQSTPAGEKVSSIFAVKPVKYEGGAKEIEVDSLCNGKITEATPPEARKKILLIESDGVIDGFDPAWRRGIQAYSESPKIGEDGNTPNYAFYVSNEVCKRPQGPGDIQIIPSISSGGALLPGPQKVTINFRSSFEAKYIQALFGTKVIHSQNISGTSGSVELQFNILPGETTYGNLNFRLIDVYGYSNSVEVGGTLTTEIPKPVITTINPIEGDTTINLYENSFFNLRFKVESMIPLTTVSLYENEKLIKIFNLDEPQFLYEVNKDSNLEIGKHTYRIQAIHDRGGKISKTVEVTILPQP